MTRHRRRSGHDPHTCVCHGSLGQGSPCHGSLCHGPDLEPHDIQGGILHGYHGEARAYVFLEVDDACAARGWLRETEPTVTSDADHPPPPVAVNLAFTCRGLHALGMPRHRLAQLPAPFREGMAARSSLLGDAGPQHADSWESPFRRDDPLHVVVMLDGSADAVAEHVEQLRSGLWQDGLVELGPPLWGRRLDGGREHFGFVDGLSQPPVEGVSGAHAASSPGQGRLRDGRWEALAPGEFVLGLPDADGVRDRTLAALTTNGSYLVLRKLEQDVPAFRRLVVDAARRSRLAEEVVAAKIMGRWADGAPLTMSPAVGDAPWGETDSDREGFTYAGDGGERCPLGAHVRRANPRGSLGFDGRLEHRHRLLRRGIPYGPPFVDDDPGTWEASRGLVFACYQADLETQFEFVQSRWLGDGDAFGLGDDVDPVVGDPARGTGVLWLDRPVRVPTVPPRESAGAVRTRGGAYLLQPGLRALRYLASLPDTPHPRSSGERS